MTTSLPEDLVFFEILTKLPTKSLMRFKCVSKSWMTRISGDPSFIDAAHRRQKNSEDNSCAFLLYNEYIDHGKDEDSKDADHEKTAPLKLKVLAEQFSKGWDVDISDLVAENGPIRIASTCEGLVCLEFKNFPEHVMLWNPATRQRRTLPCPPGNCNLQLVGIGLDDISGNWKVVRLCVHYWSDDDSSEDYSDDDQDYWSDETGPVRAHVLAKKGTVWRDCGVSGINGFLDKWSFSVAAAGALHWGFTTAGSYGLQILSFDLNDEVLRVENGPECNYFYICEWKSSLAAFAYNYDDSDVLSCDLMVASPSSCGGGLRWSKVVKLQRWDFERNLLFLREQLVLKYYVDEVLILELVDPKVPKELRNIKQPRYDLDFGYSSFGFSHYVQTIIPVF